MKWLILTATLTAGCSALTEEQRANLRALQEHQRQIEIEKAKQPQEPFRMRGGSSPSRTTCQQLGDTVNCTHY